MSEENHKGQEQANLEEVGHAELSQEHTDPSAVGNHHADQCRDLEVVGTYVLAFKESMCILSTSLFRVKLPLVFTTVVLWLYYIPAIVLSSSYLTDIQYILYGDIRVIFMAMMFWLSTSLASIHKFSFEFSKKAILFAYTPGYICGTTLALYNRSYMISFLSNIQAVLVFIFVGMGIYLISKSKRQGQLTTEQESHYEMTKDGTPLVLLKGLIGFFVFVIFLFLNLLRVYLMSPFIMRAFFRLIVFPVCFSFSKWIQVKVISKYSKENMDKRLVINKICNHYIVFIGRILISNISLNKDAYQVLLINLGAVLIDWMDAVTLLIRSRISFHTGEMVGLIKTHFFSRSQRVYPFQFSSVQGDQNPNVTHLSDLNKKEKEEAYISESISFKARYIFDDISSEMFAIVYAPLMLYFLDKIVDDECQYSTIPTFKECVYQILIQVTIKFISAALTLAYYMNRGYMKPSQFNAWSPISPYLHFTWTLYCLFQIHYTITQSSMN